MEKRDLRLALLPLVLMICLYVVFYSTIESKPNDAGFWFILFLGISIGIALTRFRDLLNKRKTDNKL